MKPKFKTTSDGIIIIDPIERQQYELKTGTPVTPIPGDENQIPFPMETTVEIVTDEIILPSTIVYIRKPDKSLIKELKINDSIRLPEEEYILDISDPLKVYARIKCGTEIHITSDRVKIDFEEKSSVSLSARSYHTRPATTITTSRNPTDMMKAVSLLGSALKTTTPERSYPTFRGHPPMINVGEESSIPNEINQPETGIQIEIPPTLRHIFVVAPLAYYLAAEVIPGSTPQLITDRGFTHLLQGENGFENEVERVLKRNFLLDCIVRTEGSTPLPLFERQAIESSLPFDIGSTYGESLADRVESYLEVPYEIIHDQFPKWSPKTQLNSTAEYIEFLPFLIKDLSTVTVVNETATSTTGKSLLKQSSIDIGQFFGNTSGRTGGGLEDDKCRSCSLKPTVNQFWSEGNSSEIASTIPLSAFQHSISQSPREGPIEIEVICNDRNMSGELVMVHSTYKGRDDVPLDVTIHHDLTRGELEELLAQKTDFIHYIGHVDIDGFRCTDGNLDVSNMDEVGVKAFFLNACCSFEQGLALIEAGSIGGIVTLSEIQNSDAINAGSTVARLLNYGLPLYATLHILQKTEENGQQYHIIGDGELAVSQTKTGAPVLNTIIEEDIGTTLRIDSHLSSKSRFGTISVPYISTVDSYYLVGNEVSLSPISKERLVEYLSFGKSPVVVDGELRWSDEIKTSEL